MFKKTSVILLYIFILSVSCRQESIDELFSRSAREYTDRYCPKPLDEIVTLDSVVYYPPTNQEKGRYAYFHNVKGNLSDIEELKKHETEIFNELLSKINNTQDLKQIKDEGVTIQYTFYSKINKKIIFDFRFTNQIYKQRKNQRCP